MEDDTLANAITYILLLRVKSFPKMYVTLCPPKWYHSPPLAHALIYRSIHRPGVGRVLGGRRSLYGRRIDRASVNRRQIDRQSVAIASVVCN